RADDSTVVSVVEGRVNVSAPRSTTAPLTAGEQANVLGDGKIIKSAAPDVTQATSWRQRRLVFRMTTLAEAAAQFNRYNSTPLLDVGEKIAQRRITGTFNADEPQALVKFLGQDPAVRLTRDSKRVVIRAATVD